MEQNEQKEMISLVDENGNLATSVGFARRPYWRYNREDLQVRRWRMKEWDYYLINTGKIAVAFTLSDLGYVRMASISYLDLEAGLDATKTILQPPVRKFIMPEESETGHSFFRTGKMILDFKSDPGRKHVRCYIPDFYKNKDFRADLMFKDIPEESMNILTPWPDRRHFYLNEKINCMPVSGTVIFDGKVIRFTEQEHCGVLDWGRGYWPYKSRWYWGTASVMVDGKPFGFNLGYGFGDLSAASENVLFYDGKVHKLGRVEFQIPQNPMDLWTISSDDGRFEATFKPRFDRKADINLQVVRSNQNQYFGFVNGTAILDDGTPYSMNDLPAAFEDIINQY